MQAQEIEKRVIAIVREELYQDEKVEAATSFREDLGFDSLDEVSLVMALEMEFQISISDEDAEKIGTVGEAVAYVAERLTHNVLAQGREPQRGEASPGAVGSAAD